MPENYPLAALLSVREHREDTARSAAKLAALATAKAQEELEQARQKLKDYRLWRKEEEKRRYGKVIGQELDKNDMDDFRAGLAALLEKEAVFGDAVTAAETVLAERQNEERIAAEALRHAVKEHARIEEHRHIWQEEADLDAERAEEKEMEN